MAEIRSTMEMVLERAARLEAEAGDSLSNEEKSQDGMRMAAQYMRGEEVDFKEIFSKPEEERALMAQGASTVFMRNVTLPREEEDQAVAGQAMMGMLQLVQDPQLQAVLDEIKKILSQYLQHKDQLRGQIEEQFAQQMGMMEQQTGSQVKLEPDQHPKFAEEWQKVMVQLNEKYGNALDQHKAYIQQLLEG